MSVNMNQMRFKPSSEAISSYIYSFIGSFIGNIASPMFGLRRDTNSPSGGESFIFIVSVCRIKGCCFDSYRNVESYIFFNFTKSDLVSQHTSTTAS